jgi:hypothetical protein
LWEEATFFAFVPTSSFLLLHHGSSSLLLHHFFFFFFVTLLHHCRCVSFCYILVHAQSLTCIVATFSAKLDAMSFAMLHVASLFFYMATGLCILAKVVAI